MASVDGRLHTRREPASTAFLQRVAFVQRRHTRVALVPQSAREVAHERSGLLRTRVLWPKALQMLRWDEQLIGASSDAARSCRTAAAREDRPEPPTRRSRDPGF